MPMDPQQLVQMNLLEVLGLQNLPEDRKQELVAKMSQVVEDRVTDRLIESMSAEHRAEFDRLVASQATPEALSAFFQKAVPNIDQITSEEIMRFKAQMAEETTTLRKMVDVTS